MMNHSTQGVIRPADQKDLHKLANLIHFESYVHRHLDYRQPLDWVGQPQFLILEQGKEVVAALACPPDPPSIAWIRLFATCSRLTPALAWKILWAEAAAKISQNQQIVFSAAIPLYSWFESLLKESGFQKTHSIVMLSWENTQLPAETPSADIAIRPMTLDDLRGVQAIDETAFTPVWQNSLTYIEIAFRQAMWATVAETDSKLVGYQISTPTSLGGHLARLAVLPQQQGKGIGYALLYDLLDQFNRRGARVVSVNTQKDNYASLALYRKAGFMMTGEEYPIYQLINQSC